MSVADAAPGLRSAPDLTVRYQSLNGHDRAYVMAGSGPALLLLHGMGSDLRTWSRVIGPLTEKHTVIAPDLLGHGLSAKPRADYSLGGYANGMRDLLSVLGIDRVSVVGHSFGGGVAMQFAYQFPERCERVVLVGTGGLGRDVSILLRSLTLPGAGPVLTAAELMPLRAALTRVARLAAHVGPLRRQGLDLEELADTVDGLSHPDARWAFLHVLRAAVDPRGQVVTMLDRSYLAKAMPMLLVWGERDRIIPVRHAHSGHAQMPGSRLEVFPTAGHFPHRDDPARFVQVVEDFLATTRPAAYDSAAWRELLRTGGSASTG